MSGTFDAAPLLAVIERRARECDQSLSGYCIELLGASFWRQVVRWQSGQRLRARTADEVCCAIGLHPSAVWGQSWWEQPS